MSLRSAAALGLLLPLLLPLEVLSQDLDLADALDFDATDQPPAPTKPRAPAGGVGGELSLDDFFDVVTTTTTKAPPKVVPKVPKPTKAPAKSKPKPVLSQDLDLADALDFDDTDQILSQDLDLADALDFDATDQPPAPTKPRAPAGGVGGELSLDDFFDVTTTTTKAPPKVVPKVPKPTKAPAKPKPKPGTRSRAAGVIFSPLCMMFTISVVLRAEFLS